MNQSRKRFFIALLPPQAVQDYANQVKQHFADYYSSKAAQKSPPHITLQPPFEWPIDDLPTLEHWLHNFALNCAPVPIKLAGFAAFPPRVIYINVLKTPELLMLQQALVDQIETRLEIADPKSKTRSFTPHLTVAFRDLTKQNFKLAWQEFESRLVLFEFTVSSLTLLIHNGQRWTVCSEFPFLLQGHSP